MLFLTLATVHKYTNVGHNVQSKEWYVGSSLSGCIILNVASILIMWYIKLCDHVLYLYTEHLNSIPMSYF